MCLEFGDYPPFSQCANVPINLTAKKDRFLCKTKNTKISKIHQAVPFFTTRWGFAYSLGLCGLHPFFRPDLLSLQNLSPCTLRTPASDGDFPQLREKQCFILSTSFSQSQRNAYHTLLCRSMQQIDFSMLHIAEFQMKDIRYKN